MHLVGVVLEGRRDFAAGALEYTLEVGNGRGPTQDPPQIVIDANASKAVNLALKLEPDALPGLEIGGAYYLDHVPENLDPTKGPVHTAFDETIGNVFVVWRRGGWQIFGEFFAIEHSQGNDAESTGWYAEVSRRFGDWTPYARADTVEIDDGDSYFTSVDDLATVGLGLRFDLSTWNALKLELDRTEVDAGPGGSDETRTALRIQTAFSF